MEGRLSWAGDLDRFVAQVETWRATGATHLSINTMKAGLGPCGGHLEVLTRIADALALSARDT
jgi:hypothetical protein